MVAHLRTCVHLKHWYFARERAFGRPFVRICSNAYIRSRSQCECESICFVFVRPSRTKDFGQNHHQHQDPAPPPPPTQSHTRNLLVSACSLRCGSGSFALRLVYACLCVEPPRAARTANPQPSAARTHASTHACNLRLSNADNTVRDVGSLWLRVQARTRLNASI